MVKLFGNYYKKYTNDKDHSLHIVNWKKNLQLTISVEGYVYSNNHVEL